MPDNFLEKLREVRRHTSAGLADCRQALNATQGDVLAAIAQLKTPEELERDRIWIHVRKLGVSKEGPVTEEEVRFLAEVEELATGRRPRELDNTFLELREFALPRASLFGEHTIVKSLGKGGMGEVFEAQIGDRIVYENAKARRCAIKILPPKFAEDSEAVSRFQREAETMRSLDHPHIVRSDKSGVHNSMHWMRMELVLFTPDGVTHTMNLGQAVHGFLDHLQLAEIMDQMLDALGYAHGKNVLHRDVKPSNILLARDEFGRHLAKLSDFGLASVLSNRRSISPFACFRKLAPPADGLTLPGTVMGTPGFMSPEQELGLQADSRSDLFSLGVTCATVLTGEVPYGVGEDLDIESDIWRDWLARMTSLDPRDRFRSAKEARFGLKKLIGKLK